MFDFGIGYSEIFVIAVVAIVVIGPKDLPHVLRALGKTLAKMRGMARDFQGHLDSAMREAGLDDVKRELQGIKSFASDSLNTAPAIKPPPAKPADNDFETYFGAPAKAEDASGDKPAGPA